MVPQHHFSPVAYHYSTLIVTVRFNSFKVHVICWLQICSKCQYKYILTITIDLRKYSIKDNEGEKSRKKDEDAPDGMYEKLMIEDEVKEVYRDRSVWGSVLSDFPTSITA